MMEVLTVRQVKSGSAPRPSYWSMGKGRRRDRHATASSSWPGAYNPVLSASCCAVQAQCLGQ